MKHLFSFLIAALCLTVAGCDRVESSAASAADGAAAADRPGAAAAGDGSSTLVHNGRTMVVESVVAVWNPEQGRLDFELLPFEPTAEDIERCRKGETFFMTTGKDSPDPEQFADRVPYGTYSFSWPFDPEATGNFDASFCSLHAHFIARRGSNLSLSFPFTMHETRVDGKLEAGAEITLIARGEGGVGEDELSWNLHLPARVYLAVDD